MKIKGKIEDQTDYKLLEILDRTRKSKQQEYQDIFFYALKELELRLDKYKRYYIDARHYHVSDKHDKDLCVKCGKDLRNDIHLKVGE